MNGFDSPLEELLFDQLSKQLPRGAPLENQVDVETICGPFRLDFMATVQNRRIGIECDGKEFHDQYRDEWRDAMILGDRRADEIIRFRGCDLTYHLEDCVFLLSKIQPLLFTERHALVVRRLASENARRYAEGETDIASCAMLTYGFIGKSRAEDYILVHRRTTEGRTTGVGREFGPVYYRYAERCGRSSLDRLIEQYRASGRGCTRTVP
jgi:hypothetical protein